MKSAAWFCLACERDANIQPALAAEMLVLQTARFRPSVWLPVATTDCGILSASDGLLGCNYSTRPCFSPCHQHYYTLLVCGFPTETLATYWLKVARFDEVVTMCHPKFAGLKVLQYSQRNQQPGVCTASLSLSQQGVYVTKMEKLLLQENSYWPDKVIISSIPHATCTCQEDDFHACRRRMVLWFKPR